jgi:low temperature requirement protein LtrA
MVRNSENCEEFGMKGLISVLGKPRTIKNQINNRKVSWLELFYDLMFAVVISRLTDGLIEHLSWPGLMRSVLIFGWFIWGWNEVSGYFDNHGNDSIINILIINVEMILTGIGAIFIPEAIEGRLASITVVLMFIELLMAIVWIGLSYFDHVHGPASRVWGTVHIVSFLIMLVSWMFLRSQLAWGLTIALLLNIFDVLIANPWLRNEYQTAGMEHQISDSLIERYGLMTMIALGEIIAGLYEGFVSPHLTINVISHFIVAIILIAFIAAIYYQVLGTLEVTLSSSIATSMTGWLFIVGIMFAYYIGVAMQLIAKFENTANQIWGNLAVSISLVAFLITVRLIVIVGTPVEKRENRHIIGRLLLIEEAFIIAVAWLPSFAELIIINVILLIIIIQGHLLVNE